jgi:hypothetical protein
MLSHDQHYGVELSVCVIPLDGHLTFNGTLFGLVVSIGMSEIFRG